jgi:hypothetical protein
LLLAALTCNAPGWGEVQEELQLPTPAPNPAPSPAPPVTLVVRGDSTAELNATGPSIIDHINRTPATSDETWMIADKADEASKTVTFESCNGGGFSASGSMTYSGGVLSGEVSCYNKNGEQSVMIVIDK